MRHLSLRKKQMQTYRKRSAPMAVILIMGLFSLAAVTLQTYINVAQSQSKQGLTPVQAAIEEQRLRLSSTEVEERREALTRLRALQRPEASRVALAALNDPVPMVRATAAAAIVYLPADESAANLIPLLGDKDEFVRQQVAYALGESRSHAGVIALIDLLTDKKDSVRGAAAVALGQIADTAAVASLAAVLNPRAGLGSSAKGSKSKREKNPLVLRAAARSLGQIKSRIGVPALIAVLLDEKAENDVRREAASALGAIGDQAALPALQHAEMGGDPYLAAAAHEAIQRISRPTPARGIE